MALLCALLKVPSFVLTSLLLALCCSAGHIRLTFFGQWTEVEPQCCSQAREELYSAPGKGRVPPAFPYPWPSAARQSRGGFRRQRDVPGRAQPLLLPASSSDPSLALLQKWGGLRNPPKQPTGGALALSCMSC